MEVVIKALQFILSLSILVVLHEFGHFFFAKLFKIKVEKFYLFFNPGFSLFKFRIGETEYGMGWIPFGGYVKIAGMVDESLDTEGFASPPQHYEFRGRPAWQRLLVMIGGVLMNLITAIIIYIFMSYSYSSVYIDNKDMYDGYAFSELAKEIGFQNGDKILSIDGKKYGNYELIAQDITISNPEYVEIIRNGSVVKLQFDSDFIPRLLKQAQVEPFLSPRMPMVIAGVDEDGVAARAGILAGDSLISMNGIKLKYHDQFATHLKELANQTVTVELVRGVNTLTATAKLNDSGLLGVTIDKIRGIKTYNVTEQSYTFLESIPEGFRRAKNMIVSYIDQMKLVFNPKTEAYKSVGSVISMGKIFSAVWDWKHFWGLTALYSIVLAVMNILPIPALDGGHVVFLLYEVIARRTPNEKFMEYAQLVGMLLLFALILLALGNDIYKLFV